jgi:hypothetical protein
LEISMPDQLRSPRRTAATPRCATFALLAIAALSLALPASALAGEVRGRVLGPGDAPLPGVTVSLANDLTGFAQQTVSGNDGAYILFNIPNNPYHLRATLEGFKEDHVDVDVRGNLPVVRDLHLSAAFAESTTVTADRENVALEADEVTTHTDIDKSLIQRFPAALPSRAFEAIVTSAPGFSKDENGRYHFQGGHSQQLLVVDGQPIGDQTTRGSTPRQPRASRPTRSRSACRSSASRSTSASPS